MHCSAASCPLLLMLHLRLSLRKLMSALHMQATQHARETLEAAAGQGKLGQAGRGAKVIYAQTDSIFASFPNATAQEAIQVSGHTDLPQSLHIMPAMLPCNTSSCMAMKHHVSNMVLLERMHCQCRPICSYSSVML